MGVFFLLLIPRPAVQSSKRDIAGRRVCVGRMNSAPCSCLHPCEPWALPALSWAQVCGKTLPSAPWLSAGNSQLSLYREVDGRVLGVYVHICCVGSASGHEWAEVHLHAGRPAEGARFPESHRGPLSAGSGQSRGQRCRQDMLVRLAGCKTRSGHSRWQVTLLFHSCRPATLHTRRVWKQESAQLAIVW